MNYKGFSKPIINCAHCSKPFERNIVHKKFCSNECYVENRKSFHPKTCRYCNKEFVSNRHVYCSDECAREYKNKKRKADENINRLTLYRRDNFTCIYCGSSSIEDRVKLSVDHIVPITKGGKHIPDNLITCCKECNSSKCNTLLSNEVIARIKSITISRNQSLSNSDMLTLKQLAKRMGRPGRYKVND